MSARMLMRVLIPLMGLALVLFGCGQDREAAGDAAQQAAEQAAETAEEAVDQAEEMGGAAGEAMSGEMSAVIQGLEMQVEAMDAEIQKIQEKLPELPAGIKEQATAKFNSLEDHFATIRTELSEAKGQMGGGDADQAMADLKDKVTGQLAAAGQELQELKEMLPDH